MKKIEIVSKKLYEVTYNTMNILIVTNKDIDCRYKKKYKVINAITRQVQNEFSTLKEIIKYYNLAL